MSSAAEGSASAPRAASRPDGGASHDGPLRLALSLPGGVAPGTFEAGAVCGLLVWMQEINALQADTVLVDVITGASAGSLTGLLAARVLLSGDDPVAVYRQAWVVAPSLSALRGVGKWAPLSLRPARRVAHKLLFAASEPGARWQQTSSVTLDVALGCLRGFSQKIPSDHGPDPDQPLLATTYLDWSSYELRELPQQSEADGAEWIQAIDSVLASASHPLAFRARSLDRQPFREGYLDSGIVNLPAGEKPLRLWYTDGGLLDNEPLGQCIAHVRQRDAAGAPSRLVILVRSSVRWPPPADNPAWSGEGRPRWTQTLARVLDLIATQAAGRDLLRVEQVNAQLGWTAEVASKLTELVPGDEQTRAELEALLGRIEEERLPFARMGQQPVISADPSKLSLTDLLEELLRTAAGLTGKQPVEVAVVTSDAAYAGPQALRSLVGFLERRQREDHFAAGYWSMLSWIEQASTLKERVRPTLIGPAVSAARTRVPEPSAGQSDPDESRKLSLRTRAQLLRIAARTGLIARADIDAFFDVREQQARRSRPLLRRDR